LCFGEELKYIAKDVADNYAKVTKFGDKKIKHMFALPPKVKSALIARGAELSS